MHAQVVLSVICFVHAVRMIVNATAKFRQDSKHF